jgi:hypothetical protein
MSDPRPRHVRVFDTPTGRFPWGGAIKGPPCLFNPASHLFQHANTLRRFVELSTSLLQVSFKSKLSRRDLSLTLE